MEIIPVSGGRCSGKTTFINELARRQKTTVPESALALIEQGVFPWTDLDYFMTRAYKLQIEQESSASGKRVYLDRCKIDNLFHYLWYERRLPDDLEKEVDEARYDFVLFLDMMPRKFWTVTGNGAPRMGSYDEAEQQFRKIRELYVKLKQPIMRVPVIVPVKDRVDYAFELLEECKNS
ncbi:ATP-binding protein [Candidatus Woesearchaeota archaeon]|nr:ATP-binding protein [Candidatus Woesearchaeota archaeon]